MSRELTPAVTRIFNALAIGQADRDLESERGSSSLSPQLLLGLLAESECRAALMLAQHSVDEDDILARWPDLAEVANAETANVESSAARQRASNGHSTISESKIGEETASAWITADSDVLLVLARAGELLADFPQPYSVATEHLLLGLVAGDDEVSGWLREQGLSTEFILNELRQQFGIDPTPLAMEDLEHAQDANMPAPTPTQQEPPPEEFDDEIATYLSSQDTNAAMPGAASQFSHLASSAAEQGSPPPAAALYRVLDAAANRAAEGFRVLEDTARFLLNDAYLTRELKHLRHGVASLISRLPQSQLIAARDVPGDVGTPLTTPTESRRQSTADLLNANFHRVQESLRSLEEFSKLFDANTSQAFKQLRYASYTLHRAAILSRNAQDALAHAKLYVLLDGGASPQAFELLAKSLIDAGTPLIQLRDKQLNDRDLLSRAGELMRYAHGTVTRVIINDRPDVAASVSAAGVHLGQEELTTDVARRILGPELLIGISTHALVQARQAVMDGANYLGVGPTFPSRTKDFDAFPGLEYARAVAAEISLPAYAISGITLANLDEVMQTGVHGVAIGAAITAANDPPQAVREFLKRLT